MKKLIAFLLCTALLAGMSVCFADDETWTCENCGQESTGNFCPYCGAAKPEGEKDEIFPEAPTGTFAIRNGIRWGMSGYEVENREEHLKDGEDETRDYYTDETYEITNLFYDTEEGKKICGFPVYMNYLFSRDKLFLITYHIEYNDSDLQFLEANTYLANALTAKYGEGHEATREEADKVRNVMDIADQYYYEEETRQITVWNLPEDTIAAILEGFYYEDSRLIYFSYDTMLNGLPADGNYNTNGL